MGYYAFFEPTDYITGTSGYSLFAEARCGANGSLAAPDTAAGSSTDFGSDYATWDEDLSDGFDSGVVGASCTASPVSGTIEFGTALSNGAVTFDGTDNLDASVGSVLIKTAAAVPGRVTFSNLTITFWKNGVQQDSVIVNGTVTADSTNSSTGAAEQILAVTPAVGGSDQVTVVGAFRMQCAGGMCPGWNDLFSQILIMPGG